MSVGSMYRFHHSHDEEDLKGPRQGYFSQVAGRGASISILIYIYYIIGEREKDGLYPREILPPSRGPRDQG